MDDPGRCRVPGSEQSDRVPVAYVQPRPVAARARTRFVRPMGAGAGHRMGQGAIYKQDNRAQEMKRGDAE